MLELHLFLLEYIQHSNSHRGLPDQVKERESTRSGGRRCGAFAVHDGAKIDGGCGGRRRSMGLRWKAEIDGAAVGGGDRRGLWWDEEIEGLVGAVNVNLEEKERN
ncbi:hypothetical protein R6Q59_029151 [Mikania micrantha]